MARAENILGDNQNFLQTADGTMARKGSVAALIATVNAIDSSLEKKSEVSTQDLEDLQLLLPTLHSIGFFEFFHPLEWLQETPRLREGKCWVAYLYLKKHPEKMTDAIKSRLLEILPSISSNLKHAIQSDIINK